MRFVEPTFEIGGELWRTLPDVPDANVHAPEKKLARQSVELNRRLTEVLELHAE